MAEDASTYAEPAMREEAICSGNEPEFHFDELAPNFQDMSPISMQPAFIAHEEGSSDLDDGSDLEEESPPTKGKRKRHQEDNDEEEKQQQRTKGKRPVDSNPRRQNLEVKLLNYYIKKFESLYVSI